MCEYRKYRGYYIGPGAFQTKAEIDNFIKQQAIRRYQSYCRSFLRDRTIEASVVMSNHADYMHNVCGMSYDEIEAIEIEVFSA